IEDQDNAEVKKIETKKDQASDALSNSAGAPMLIGTGGTTRKANSGRWKPVNLRTVNCLFCSAKEFTISSFLEHLKKAHKTTPFNAGIAFRCACGFVATNAHAARIHRDEAGKHPYNKHPAAFSAIA
ncbi:hypothetical protein PMAYCL1PPCAC_05007, partial [Pristionchus mayeri]